MNGTQILNLACATAVGHHCKTTKQLYLSGRLASVPNGLSERTGRRNVIGLARIASVHNRVIEPWGLVQNLVPASREAILDDYLLRLDAVAAPATIPTVPPSAAPTPPGRSTAGPSH
jgi:hypothetical protein